MWMMGARRNLAPAVAMQQVIDRGRVDRAPNLLFIRAPDTAHFQNATGNRCFAERVV